MNNDLRKPWYVKNADRLVIKYRFTYDVSDIDGEIDRMREYNKKFAEFLEATGISSDKIVKVEKDGDMCDIIHVYGDGGIEPLALVEVNMQNVQDRALLIDLFPDGLREGDNRFIFMGEIPNMPSHCVVAEYATGKLHCGVHTAMFEPIKADI